MTKIKDGTFETYLREYAKRDEYYDLDADDQRDLIFMYLEFFDKLLPAALEAYSATMGDDFDASKLAAIPDFVNERFKDQVEDWYYD